MRDDDPGFVLPDNIWHLALFPPPWPAYLQPGFDASDDGSLPLDLFGRLTETAFAFLLGLGFQDPIFDIDHDAELASTIWLRPDAIAAAYWHPPYSFVFAVSPPPAPDAIGGYPAALAPAAQEGAGKFGTFTLSSGSEEAAVQLGTFASSIEAAIAAPLQSRPVDFGTLESALSQALHGLINVWWIAHYQRVADDSWAAEHYEAYLHAVRQLQSATGTEPDPERLAIARSRMREPLSLGEDVRGEADRIRRASLLLEEKRAAIHSRMADGDRYELANQFHEAFALMYPPEFWANVERLGRGDPTAIDMAVTFLEVDPWCFRSGYTKERILRFLRRIELSESQSAKLRTVILVAIDAGDRREFRGYCRLARLVVNADFLGELFERLLSEDGGRARRAFWIVDAIGAPLDGKRLEAAWRVMRGAAREGTWWRAHHWLGPLAAKYVSSDWIGRLVADALSGGDDLSSAVYLLTAIAERMDVPLSNEQRTEFGELVKHSVLTGEGQWFEDLARLADSPRLRSWLVGAYDSAKTDGQRQRIHWSINAIGRAHDPGWNNHDLTRARHEWT